MRVKRIDPSGVPPLANGSYAGGRRRAVTLSLGMITLLAAAPYIPHLAYRREWGRPFSVGAIGFTVLVGLVLLAWLVARVLRGSAMHIDREGVRLLEVGEVARWRDVEGAVLLRSAEAGRPRGPVLLSESGDPMLCAATSDFGARVVQRLGSGVQAEGQALFEYTGPVTKRMLAGGAGWETFGSRGVAD